MKSSAEYLTGPVFQLTYPTGEVAESVPVITYDDAIRALEEALADAEEYKYLLLRAIRRTRSHYHLIRSRGAAFLRCRCLG